MSRSASSFIRKELKVSNNNSLIDEPILNNSGLNMQPNRSASPIMFQDSKKKRPQSGGSSRMNRSKIDAPLPPPSIDELRASSPILQRSTSPVLNRASSPIQRSSSPIHMNRASSPVNRSNSSLGNHNSNSYNNTSNNNNTNNNTNNNNRFDRNEMMNFRSSTDMGMIKNNRLDLDLSPSKMRDFSQTSFDRPIKRAASASGSRRSSNQQQVISPANSVVSSLHSYYNSPKNHHNTTTYNSNFTSSNQNTFVPPKVNSSLSSNHSGGGNGLFSNRSSQQYSSVNSSINGNSPTNRELINQYYAKHGYNSHSKQENEKHVPTHLRDLDYSKSNDVLEVVKDKIHGLSPSLSEAFRRIKQATGYTGGKVKSDDFKKAIIKDFHLLDEVPSDLPNFLAVQQYQNEQVKKIDEFIRMADPNNDGYFGYSEFNRAMEQLEKQLGTNTTTSQRESRYCGTMNHEAIRRRRERNEQQIERIMDPKKERAPYGVHDDLVHSINQVNTSYNNKLENLRSAFPIYGDTDRVPLSVFRETLKKFDRYILDVDLDQMIESLHGKRRGYISLNEFMNAYGFETIKSKSFRGSYESVKPLQWPATLENQSSTSDKIRDLRDKHTKKKLKGRVNNTRTNILRAEEIRRNASSAMSNYSSPSSSYYQDRSLENSSTKSSSFMKTPNYLLSHSQGGANKM
ncbi:predicted protein [Naegleria gruberi]|uniref:Predicted protein n=1 Tax=Naegleria gruberi TaxID=5762 RepID=D2VHX5_NAEGR|nr:uncharacterized protein NAEGRDRAFT_49678 [Naegleria gruberi]EFC43751.1 predicted protein [Naegleria gruberi]|eukprot:XP_002676495.1 predicted protein [Naegleria gruberi strain NEG-M]